MSPFSENILYKVFHVKIFWGKRTKRLPKVTANHSRGFEKSHEMATEKIFKFLPIRIHLQIKHSILSPLESSINGYWYHPIRSRYAYWTFSELKPRAVSTPSISIKGLQFCYLEPYNQVETFATKTRHNQNLAFSNIGNDNIVRIFALSRSRLTFSDICHQKMQPPLLRPRYDGIQRTVRPNSAIFRLL